VTGPAKAMKLIDKNSIFEALKAGRARSISVAPAARDARVLEIMQLAEELGVPVNTVDTAGKNRGRGARRRGASQPAIEAYCDPFEYAPLEHLREEIADAGNSAVIIALDHVQDPRNLGAILRTAAAAGARGAIIERRRCCEVTDVAYETSCGGADRVPVVMASNLRQALSQMKEWGCWIAGADERAEKDCWSHDLAPDPLVLVLGSEGEGLSRIVRKECDFLLRIPTVPEFPSLNVSVAASVLIFEAARQKSILR